MKNLPPGWCWTTADQLTAPSPNSLTIGPFGSNLKVSDYAESGVPLVFVRDIRRHDFGGPDTKYVSKEKAREIAAHSVYPGDLLVTKMGDPPGDTTVYPNTRPPGIITADCIKLTANKLVTSSEFLAFSLRAPYVKKSLLEQTKGVAQQKLSLERFRQIPLPLPPLAEQYRIVSKLESLLARSRRAKKALDAIPTLLERFRQSVLAAAFRGGLTADWRVKHADIEPASKLLERIRAERRRRWEEAELEKMRAKGKAPKDDSWRGKYEEPAPIDFGPLPPLPEKWCWASVDDLLPATEPICYGVVQPGSETEGGIPLVRVCDLVDGTVEIEQLRTISAAVDEEYARSRLNGGEVLVSVVGTIGRVAIAPPETRGANIARAIARLSFTSSVPVDWAAAWLSAPYMQDRLNRDAREVARKTLNLSTLQRAPVPLAPLAEMSRIATSILRSIESARRLETAYKAIQETSDTLEPALLAKAFRGELVPQDPNDEPASVLLERIRAEREAAAGSAPKRPRGRRPAA